MVGRAAAGQRRGREDEDYSTGSATTTSSPQLRL